MLVCAPGLDHVRPRATTASPCTCAGLARGLAAARGRVAATAGRDRRRAGGTPAGSGRFDVVEAPEWQAIAAGFARVRRSRLLICCRRRRAVDRRPRPAVPAPVACQRLDRALDRAPGRRGLSLSQLLVDELRRTGWLDPSTYRSSIAPPVVDPGESGRRVPSATAAPTGRAGRRTPRATQGVRPPARGRRGAQRCPRGVAWSSSASAIGDSGRRRLGDAGRPTLGVELRLLGRGRTRADLPASWPAAGWWCCRARFDSFNMAGLEAWRRACRSSLTDRVGLGELADGSERHHRRARRRADAFAAALRPAARR